MTRSERIKAAVVVARCNGYKVTVAERPTVTIVRVVSPSGRSDYEYYFFVDSDESEFEETLNDLINWVK